MPLANANLITHAPRWEIHQSALGVPHDEVRIPTRGRAQAVGLVRAVAQRRGRAREPRLRRKPRSPGPATWRCWRATATACSRSTTPATARARGTPTASATTPRRGSTAGLDWLKRQPGVDPSRIAGFGLSLGGEVLLEAASRDKRFAGRRLRRRRSPRWISGRAIEPGAVLGGALIGITEQEVRVISGMKPSRSLVEFMPSGSRRARCCSWAGGRIPARSRPSRGCTSARAATP